LYNFTAAEQYSMPGISKLLDFERDLRSPEVPSRYVASLCLELEHSALPEGKFEQYLDSVEHSCLHQCHHHLTSTSFSSHSP